MVESRSSFRFLQEASFLGFIGSEVMREELERNEAIELRVLGLIDDTHASLSELL
jgi:hypothetical protein